MFFAADAVARVVEAADEIGGVGGRKREHVPSSAHAPAQLLRLERRDKSVSSISFG